MNWRIILALAAIATLAAGAFLMFGCAGPATVPAHIYTNLTPTPSTIPSAAPAVQDAGSGIAAASASVVTVQAGIEAATAATFEATKAGFVSGLASAVASMSRATDQIAQARKLVAQHETREGTLEQGNKDRDSALAASQKDAEQYRQTIVIRDKEVAALKAQLSDQGMWWVRAIMTLGLVLSIASIVGGVIVFGYLKAQWGLWVAGGGALCFVVCMAGLIYPKPLAIGGCIVAAVLVIGIITLAIIELRHQFSSVVKGVQAGIATGDIDLAKVGKLFNATQSLGAKAFVDAHTPDKKKAAIIPAGGIAAEPGNETVKTATSPAVGGGQ